MSLMNAARPRPDWLVMTVLGDSRNAGWAYTAGLLRHHHPEIVVFGLPPRTAHGLLNDLGRTVRAGGRFEPGQRYADLVNHPVAFRPVHSNWQRVILTHAFDTHDGPFEALQLVWPDMAGRFPWERGAERWIRRDQPALEAASAHEARLEPLLAELAVQLVVERRGSAPV